MYFASFTLLKSVQQALIKTTFYDLWMTLGPFDHRVQKWLDDPKKSLDDAVALQQAYETRRRSMQKVCL